MTIRKAKPDDLDAVCQLLCELEETALPRDAFRDVFLNNLQNPAVFYFVAEQAQQLIAFASLHINLLLHHCAGVAEIEELVVKAGCRDAGVGKAMVGALDAAARANGCALIEVCCNRKRVRSHGFYTRCGFLKSHYKFTKNLNLLK